MSDIQSLIDIQFFFLSYILPKCTGYEFAGRTFISFAQSDYTSLDYLKIIIEPIIWHSMGFRKSLITNI